MDLSSLSTSLDLGVLLRVVIAMLIGGALGLERELAGKPAGLRTFMFVSGGACLLVLLGQIVIDETQATQGNSVLRTDPLRLFEAIVVGVSFLGTGTIWKSENEHRVEGLTTGAALLFGAALGIAVAVDRALLAAGLAVLALLVGAGLRSAERALGSRPRADRERDAS